MTQRAIAAIPTPMPIRSIARCCLLVLWSILGGAPEAKAIGRASSGSYLCQRYLYMVGPLAKDVAGPFIDYQLSRMHSQNERLQDPVIAARVHVIDALYDQAGQDYLAAKNKRVSYQSDRAYRAVIKRLDKIRFALLKEKEELLHPKPQPQISHVGGSAVVVGEQTHGNIYLYGGAVAFAPDGVKWDLLHGGAEAFDPYGVKWDLELFSIQHTSSKGAHYILTGYDTESGTELFPSYKIEELTLALQQSARENPHIESRINTDDSIEVSVENDFVLRAASHRLPALEVGKTYRARLTMVSGKDFSDIEILITDPHTEGTVP